MKSTRKTKKELLEEIDRLKKEVDYWQKESLTPRYPVYPWNPWDVIPPQPLPDPFKDDDNSYEECAIARFFREHPEATSVGMVCGCKRCANRITCNNETTQITC